MTIDCNASVNARDDAATGATADVSVSSRHLPWTIFAIASILYLVTAAYDVASGDVVTSNLAAWKLATGTRPYLDQIDYPALDTHAARDVWVILDANGREIIGRAGGPILLAMPAYALYSWGLGMDGFNIIPGAVTAAIAGAASIGLFAATVRPWLSAKHTVLAAFTLAFGTPMWSVAANATWPQTVTVLGISAMAWAASRERWLLAGVFGGVVLWGRVQAAVIVAVVGLMLGYLRRRPSLTFRVGAISAVFLGLLMAWTRWMYGSWNPTAYYNPVDLARYEPAGWFDPVNQLGSWLSPDRGILVWTPLLLVLLPVLARHWRQVPDWSRALAVGGVVYTALEAALIQFPGGDTFYGYRMTLELLMCLAPAVAIAAQHMGRLASNLLAPLIALQFVAISAGAVNNQLGLPVDVVWQQNSFVSAAFYKPTIGVFTVAATMMVAFLARRIWQDPAVRRRRSTT